jgi:hypothetical protein
MQSTSRTTNDGGFANIAALTPQDNPRKSSSNASTASANCFVLCMALFVSRVNGEPRRILLGRLFGAVGAAPAAMTGVVVGLDAVDQF